MSAGAGVAAAGAGVFVSAGAGAVVAAAAAGAGVGVADVSLEAAGCWLHAFNARHTSALTVSGIITFVNFILLTPFLRVGVH